MFRSLINGYWETSELCRACLMMLDGRMFEVREGRLELRDRMRMQS